MKILYTIIFLFTFNVQAQSEQKEEKKKERRMGAVSDIKRKREATPIQDEEKKERRMGTVSDIKRKREVAPIEPTEEHIEEDPVLETPLPEVVEEPVLETPLPEVEEEPVLETPLPEVQEEEPVVEIPLPFEEPAPPKVDILFVIDNSRSMSPIWKTIDQRISSFFEHLSEVDWRLAFITSNFDTPDKTLMPLEYNGEVLNQFVLSPEQENYTQIFIDTLLKNKKKPCQWPPYCGGATEQPLKALQNYLFTHFEDSFVRENANLSVVILTDTKENKGSFDFIAQPEELVNLFHTFYANQDLKVYTFTITDKECSKKMKRLQFPYIEGKRSHLVHRLGDLTQGKNFSLCLETYDHVAGAIAQSFMEGEENE